MCVGSVLFTRDQSDEAQMMASVADLQREVEIAREGLRSVDEDIKKLIGRDPSEFRPTAGRRVMLKRDFAERNTGGPMTKRRVSTGGQPRIWSRVVTSRISLDGKRPSSRLDSEGEDEDEDASKPAIQSSVVATPNPSRLKREVLIKTDDTTKSRNRRMFGMLRGTLERFKSDSARKSERERRREEINKKLEEAEEKERENAATQRKELFSTRRAKQAELRRLERRINLTELQEAWDVHTLKMCGFIKTKALPSVFFLPAKHTEKTTKLLEESARATKRAMAKRRAEIEEELEAEAESEKNARESGSKESTSDGKTGVEISDEMIQEVDESFISAGDVEMKSTDHSLQDDGLDEGELEQSP